MEEKETLIAHYGELHNPDSMSYESKSGECLIEVFASEKIPDAQKQELLAEIDLLIRKHFTIEQ